MNKYVKSGLSKYFWSVPTIIVESPMVAIELKCARDDIIAADINGVRECAQLGKSCRDARV